MTVTSHWTIADLDYNLTQQGDRYEIFSGELYVSKQPRCYHQRVCFKIGNQLEAWNDETALGEMNLAPGIILSDKDAVAPDLVWTSRARLAVALNEDGKLHSAPELVIDVISPGKDNEIRDQVSQRGERLARSL